jgi:hypothetical protein
MDVDMFANMLFGKKDLAEAYIESKEGKAHICVNSYLTAVLQILVDKKIVTENELIEYQEKMEELYKDKIREEFKKLQEQ